MSIKSNKGERNNDESNKRKRKVQFISQWLTRIETDVYITQ